jgi:hypothetical protein
MSGNVAGMVVARVEVVQYLNDEGQVWWDIDHSEGTPLTQLIGLLHTAALELYLRAKESE